MRDIERVIFCADILEIPDILDFSASMVFLDNLDKTLRYLVFSLTANRTHEPCVPTMREKGDEG